MHPLDQALTILATALPDRSLEALAQLPIGQRDAYLLLLREMTFGSQLESCAACPHCRELLEFSLQTQEIRLIEPDQFTPPNLHCKTEQHSLQFRLPNSQDLAAVIHSHPLELAQQQLAQRCLETVPSDSQAIALLSPEVIDQFSHQVSELDPQAELLLDLQCPACGHEWQVVFDIVSYFWTELTAQAKRLLQEVHILARAYGWYEAEILALSPLRRKLYLERVLG
ncbi:MAG: hypothetical protein VKJ24_15905 [Synechococcales bacterium]|nr:hypothetical protein [Synechococcales bacterium]